jgi:hypothetical protein
MSTPPWIVGRTPTRGATLSQVLAALDRYADAIRELIPRCPEGARTYYETIERCKAELIDVISQYGTIAHD